MKLFLCAALIISSSYTNAAGDFIPIDIEGDYEKFGVHVATSTMGSIAMLELENISGDVLNCQGVFRYGPEVPVTRKVVLKSGAKKVLSARLFRDVIRLKIIVDCEESA